MKTTTAPTPVRFNPFAKQAAMPTSGDRTGSSKLPSAVKIIRK